MLSYPLTYDHALLLERLEDIISHEEILFLEMFAASSTTLYILKG